MQTNNQRRIYHLLTFHNPLGSEDDFRSGFETSVKVTTKSPSQDYTHPDDHNLRTYAMTPGFKSFKNFILNHRRRATHSITRELNCKLYWPAVWKSGIFSQIKLLFTFFQ